jgi:hypothetical protein
MIDHSTTCMELQNLSGLEICTCSGVETQLLTFDDKLIKEEIKQRDLKEIVCTVGTCNQPCIGMRGFAVHLRATHKMHYTEMEMIYRKMGIRN